MAASGGAAKSPPVATHRGRIATGDSNTSRLQAKCNNQSGSLGTRTGDVKDCDLGVNSTGRVSMPTTAWADLVTDHKRLLDTFARWAPDALSDKQIEWAHC